MNAKHEYEFIANFKVMQNIFKAKKIDRVRSRQKKAFFTDKLYLFLKAHSS
jgi:hypothetical protein